MQDSEPIESSADGSFHGELSVAIEGYAIYSARALYRPNEPRDENPVELFLGPVSDRLSAPAKIVDVLKAKSLLRDFQRLSRLTEKRARSDASFATAVVRFANAYGLLGKPEYFQTSEANQTRWGELLSLWWSELAKFRRTHELYELISLSESKAGEDVAKDRIHAANLQLSNLMRWSADGNSVVYSDARDGGIVGHLIAERGSPSGKKVLDNWRTFELVGPAKLILQRRIAQASSGQFSLVPLSIGRSGSSGLRVLPSSLLGAIYLRLSQQVSGKAHPRPCAYLGCKNGGFFTTGPSHKKVCGASCRSGNRPKEAQDETSQAAS